ncbi:hypothetical protein BWI97_26325 [Siphonobacter sp. BAB-5405]|uniref:WG repeat-containing protein n=1 Tax=Siphonobacter sp. BAB-5405 TaxID=1864825 RepID=UPI000C8034E0|nr:WG repeat-containing protein [Siphonobacter sp. BAB-5405]PMD86519.1 hypothetical protein BWI97_26325 [Siphonobacter sp. BAB-5405]
MKRLLSMLLICLPFPGFAQSLDPLHTIESKVFQGMIDYTSRKPHWAREFDEVGYSEGVFICHKYIHTPNLYQNDTISYRRSFKTYLYSTEGKRLSSQPYDDIGAFTEGLAPVVIKKPLHDGNFVGIHGKGRTGFINTKGEVVIPLIYTWISNFHEGVAFVGDSLERYGFFIDRHNRVVFKEKFSPFITTQFHNGICLVVDRNHQPNYLTHQCELLMPRVFDFIEDVAYSRPLRVVAKSGKYGLLGANTQSQLPLTYDLIDTTRKNQWRGWYQTRRNQGYGYVDAETGVEIMKPVFEDLRPASFSSLWAKKNRNGDCFKPVNR